MIRALIADDEMLSRRALRQLLERHPDVEIVAECRDGTEAREAMEALTPDVAFLDVRMPLENGLQVAHRRGERHRTFVVFVSAFDQFALPTFDADAADYLTKPLTEVRFDAALDRVRDRAQTRHLAEQFVNQAEHKPERTVGRRHLVARVGSTDLVIPLDTVDYIRADDVYAIVVSGSKQQLVRTSLDALERSLDPEVFARVHRSYIVRIDRVVALRRRLRGAELLVSGGAVLPVSRRRRGRVAALFGGP